MEALPSGTRPASTRHAPLSLTDRVVVYCRQTSAANNASVLRNVAKPSADEMAEYLHVTAEHGISLYGDSALVRLLLADSDYDHVCREVFTLEDAIEWYAGDESASGDALPTLEALLKASHVFSDEQIYGAYALAVGRGLEEVLPLFPPHGEGGGGFAASEASHDISMVVKMPAELPVSVTMAAESKSDAKHAAIASGDGVSHPVPEASDTEAQQTRRRTPDMDVEPTAFDTHPEFVDAEREADADTAVGGAKTSHEEDVDSKNEERGDARRRVVERWLREVVEPIVARMSHDEETVREHESAEDSRVELALDGEELVASARLVEAVAIDPQQEETTSRSLASTIDGEPYTDVAGDETRQPLASEMVAKLEGVVEDEDTSTSGIDGEHDNATIGAAADGAHDTNGQHEDEAAVPSGSPTLPVADSQEEHNGEHVHRNPLTQDGEVIEDPAGWLADRQPTVALLSGMLDRELNRDSVADESDDRAIGDDAIRLEREYEPPQPVAISSSAVEDQCVSTTEHPVIVHVVRMPADATGQREDSAATSKFAVGDVVEARFRGRDRYFRGTIVVAYGDSGSYDILYNDGDAESCVGGDLIRHLPEQRPSPQAEPSVEQQAPSSSFQQGDAVEARYRGWELYLPVEIAAVRGSECYDIRYEDGEYEDGVPSERIRLRLAPAATDEPPPLRTCDAESYTVGDWVEALYRRQTRWFSARVAAENSSSHETTYTISYDDGDQEDGVMACHVRRRPGPAARTSAPAEKIPETDSLHAATVVSVGHVAAEASVDVEPPIDERGEHATDGSLAHDLQVGDRVRVHQRRGVFALATIVSVHHRRDEDSFDVVYDLGRTKETHVPRSRVERTDGKRVAASGLGLVESGDEPQRPRSDAHIVTVTPVVPFRETDDVELNGHDEPKRGASRDAGDGLSVIESARALLREAVADDADIAALNGSEKTTPSEPSDEDEDEEDLDVDAVLQATTRLSIPTMSRDKPPPPQRPKTGSSSAQKPPPTSSTLRTARKQPSPQEPFSVPPHSARTSETRSIERPKTGGSHSSSPRAATARRGRNPHREEAPRVSWKELEEWKNVDLILNRKRRVVRHGLVEGSDVPWGEEFAAIQSLKRFAAQYPDVLRQHIEQQLQELVNSSSAGAARGTTTAARDALFLVKDLAFLLRHRLGPFLDSILPVVLPAVFHSQKRFLCDTAYEVLEALVTHCSSRKLVVALLKQALQFPRDDLRLVNLTCLYVEKCLATLSVVAIQELLTRSASSVLEGTAELLTCKSAACQISLQKSLLLIQLAVGEDMMERLLDGHLVGNALVVVRRHLALAESSARGGTKSPSTSPKKLQYQQQCGGGSTPAKPTNAAVAASPVGGVSILQRMLAQRQNRVVPATEWM